MISKRLCLRIKKHLVNHNIKQVDLANTLGVSKQQLNGVINGRVENLSLELKLMEELGFYEKNK